MCVVRCSVASRVALVSGLRVSARLPGVWSDVPIAISNEPCPVCKRMSTDIDLDIQDSRAMGVWFSDGYHRWYHTWAEVARPTALWTHAMCIRCWRHQNGQRVPTRVKDPDREICCFCGGPALSGIYIHSDPMNTMCQGTTRFHRERVKRE